MKTQLEEQSSKYIDKKKAMKFRRMNIGNKNKRLEIIGIGKQWWNRRRQRVFWQHNKNMEEEEEEQEEEESDVWNKKS